MHNSLRGIANSELTGEIMFNAGRASAYVLTRNFEGKPKVLIGKDTRISADMLESAFASGLTSMGVDVILLGVVPAPAVSYLTRQYAAQAGFMLTSAIDTYEYNGLYVYSADGLRNYAAEKEIISVVSNDWALDLPPKSQLGRITHNNDGVYDYIAYAKSTVSTDLKGLKIAVDCANGVNSYIAPKIFRDFGATVFEINNMPDGININNGGVKNKEQLKEIVVSRDADIGIAFDGEGSSVLIIDEKGQEVSGDGILAVCAIDMFNKGNLTDNTVVATNINTGFKRYAAELGINVIETNDNFLNLIKGLGGDTEGNMVLSQYTNVSDGIISVLKFLSILKNSFKTVSGIISDINFMPQIIVKANVKKENLEAYKSDTLIIAEVERLNTEFNGEGRIIIKPCTARCAVDVIMEGEDIDYITERATEVAKLLELKYN